MPAILAFEKISKRFGAVVVARALDLALAEGEALGIIGPNGAGKTTLFGIASGTAPRPPFPPGHRPLVSDSAAVKRHDRVREPGGGGGVRRRPPRARRLCGLRRAHRTMRPRSQGQSARPQPHAPR